MSAALITPSMEALARQMKRHARTGFYNGLDADSPYFRQAKQLHEPTGTLLILTRDIGMHSSGWFSNPDFERCHHLSISFWDLERNVPRPFETRLSVAWTRCMFGHWTRYIWEESSSIPNHPAEVRHYRVMCNPKWQPILPRGEVYTREFIEIGWKSWSDQQYERQQASYASQVVLDP